MNGNEDGAPVDSTTAAGRSRRRAVVIGSLSALAMVGVLVTAGLLHSGGNTSDDAAVATGAARDDGRTDRPSTSSTSRPSTSSTSRPATTSRETPPGTAGDSAALDPESAARDATGTLETFLELSDDALQAPAEMPDGVDAVAHGPARGELENTAGEFADNKWRQEGSVAVVARRVTSVALDQTPPAVTVQTCIDSTDVRVVDERGESLSGGPAGESVRTPHLYTMEFVDSSWKVAVHSFPDASSC
ncbi:hypothetical protein GCM10009676_40430 [Prauserella halophila]|uniref:Secreted protein n=1 Tax=Prauserella halophila TaxID=185641 RepID=A0ABP4H492_9PSEU|nr:hypothetical protein [Prauserella halophila]MCP2236794.1 hypothetical protein [Prauserella halophila]